MGDYRIFQWSFRGRSNNFPLFHSFFVPYIRHLRPPRFPGTHNAKRRKMKAGNTYNTHNITEKRGPVSKIRSVRNVTRQRVLIRTKVGKRKTQCFFKSCQNESIGVILVCLPPPSSLALSVSAVQSRACHAHTG